MESGDDKILSVSYTASRSDADTVPQDGQQDTQSDSLLNGPIREDMEFRAERTVKPGKKTRSARARNNLRKSLAWDKAFSTDEGVLDIDELPLVTKTQRKPLELRLLDIPEILGKVSASPHSVRKTPTADAARGSESMAYSPIQGIIQPQWLPDAEAARNTPNPVQVSAYPESLPSAETGRITGSRTTDPTHLECLPRDLSNSLTLENSSLRSNSPAVAPSDLGTKMRKLDSEPSASVTGVVKQDVLKGTSGKRGKIDIPLKSVSLPQKELLRRSKSSAPALSPSSASSVLSNKVSSVSKKVKDTLGKALSGNFGGSARQLKARERLVHQGQGAKISLTPLGHKVDVNGEDLDSQGPAASAKSKTSRRFLSGNSSDATRKKDVQMETKNLNVNQVDQFLNGTSVLSGKGSSTGKEVGSLSKKGADNRSFYSTKLSPIFTRKKSGHGRPEGPPVDNSDHVNTSQSGKGVSSGLRLPSPKMGFFDKQTRPATAERASNSLSERPRGAASDNSRWLRSKKGLPPRPEHGVSSSRSAPPAADGNLAAVASQSSSSGIPSAPHLRPAKPLVSAVSALKSPHKNHHGMLSPKSHKKVATDRGVASQRNSDRKSPTIRNYLDAFQNLAPDYTAYNSDQPPRLVGPREVDAQSQARESSDSLHEAHVKSGSFNEDKSSNELALSPCLTTRDFAEQPDRCSADSVPLLGSPQSSGLIDKSGRPCTLPSVVEDIMEAKDTVFYGESESSIRNGSDEHSLSSRVDPSGTVCHKSSPLRLDGSAIQDSDRDGGAHMPSSPKTIGISVSSPAQKETVGPGGERAAMVSLDLERNPSSDPALITIHEIQDSSKFSEGHSAVMDDSSCCAEGEFAFEESGKVISSRDDVLSTEDYRSIPETMEKNTMYFTRGAEEERVPESTSPLARHLEKAHVTNSKNDFSESPSHWSDWPILSTSNKPSSQSLSVKEQTPGLTPASTRPSWIGPIAAENTQLDNPDISANSLPPSPGQDNRGSRNPLTVNVGLMNGISWRSSRSPVPKERNAQLEFDLSASDMTTGQENKRNSDGLIGSPHLRKPKQRKPNSSQKSEQPEAYAELFSEERLRALEAAGAESLQKKTGAVQHSPPNKISPNRNPWSPVKRNGQQPLGPFDCTKKHSSVFSGK